MNATPEIHRDDLASKTGMWFFLFTEMLLFGGLFIVYSIYRYRNAEAFHLAAQELSVVIGTINTIILLVSSTTIAMSITAIQLKNKKLALIFLCSTIILGYIHNYPLHSISERLTAPPAMCNSISVGTRHVNGVKPPTLVPGAFDDYFQQGLLIKRSEVVSTYQDRGKFFIFFP